MNVIVKRGPAGVGGVFSDMLQEDGTPFCKTLERTWQQADGSYAPKIPVGTWTAVRRLSPHFGEELFMLTDVPGHDYLELHPANWTSQLDGCIALGEVADPNATPPMLEQSRKAFDAFMALQAGVDTITIVIS